MMAMILNRSLRGAFLAEIGSLIRDALRIGGGDARDAGHGADEWERGLALLAREGAAGSCAPRAFEVCRRLTVGEVLDEACRQIVSRRAYPTDHSSDLTRARLLREARPDLGELHDKLIVEGLRRSIDAHLAWRGVRGERRRTLERARATATVDDVPTIMRAATMGIGEAREER